MSFQHCPTCRIEYVAAARACADCGGALQPGSPPQEIDVTDGAAPGGHAVADPGARPDTLLTRLSGQEADYLARALAEGGMFALLTCGSESQLVGPGRLPSMPLAVTYAVDVYVAAASLTEARELLDALTHDGVVVPALGADVDLDALAIGSPAEDPSATAEDLEIETLEGLPSGEVEAEGTGGRVALVLLIAAALLVWMLAG